MQSLNSFLIQHSSSVRKVLQQSTQTFFSVVDSDYLVRPYIFNFSQNNQELNQVDLSRAGELENYVNQKIKNGNLSVGVGGYGENRLLYGRSSHYTADGEARSIHLAVDLWLPAGNTVFSPLEGVIHSFADNSQFLDYGPTVILRHTLDDVVFYTLYGHLSRESLTSLEIDQPIVAGSKIGVIGTNKENGQWPPHLHFQIITDLLGKFGDFPGVCRPSEQEYYLTLCPDPNLILRLPILSGDR